MSPQRAVAVMAFAAILAPALAAAQVNFPKGGYYAGLGDSVAAGEGALPVTSGYVYDLYDRGVFGKKQEMEFSNAAVRGARSWELRSHQVSQVLCVKTAQRPTVVTITAGANDIFAGDPDIASIACAGGGFGQRAAQQQSWIRGVTGSRPGNAVAVSSARQCDDSGVELLQHSASCAECIRPAGYRPARIRSSTAILAPACSRAAGIESGSRRPLYTFSGTTGAGHDRTVRLGFQGPFDFDPHPTNVGHAFIAKQFEDAWRSVN